MWLQEENYQYKWKKIPKTALSPNSNDYGNREKGMWSSHSYRNKYL